MWAGNTLLTAGRPVATGMGAPAMGVPPVKPPRLLSSSSSLPLAGTATSSDHSPVDGEEEQYELGVSLRFVFGPVPSMKEAGDAISILKRMLAPLRLSEVLGDGFVHNLDEENKADKIPASIELLNQRASGSSQHLLHRPNTSKALDAFRLLESNPSVQNMVLSLSSDETVWNAVMNNELVQKLRASLESDNRLCAAKTSTTSNSSEGPDIVGIILGWIYENTKAKIMEIIDKVMQLISVIFQSSEKEENFNAVDDLLRSSLMLSVMVFIIVIVIRLQGA